MIDTLTLTITQAHDALMKDDYSATELVAAHVAVIEAKNPELNAVLEVFTDWKEQAAEADKMIAEAKANGGKMKDGSALPLLAGIPIIIKDNILFEGHKASASSKMLENYTATYSSAVIKKLRSLGAIILGRANMDEFAMGTSTENSAFGPARNPHDPTRVPGGSSGGVASAVAAGMCLAALGSDTGGSVRQPAALCGVVGMKPSYGYVTRHGVIAMGNSLDQIGPMARTAKDAAILNDAISFYDAADAMSVPENLRATYIEKEQKAKSGNGANGAIKTIGVPWSEVEREGMNPETLANFKASIEKLRESGYTIKDVSLPTMKYSLSVYYILMPAEVSTNLSRFDGIRYGHSAEGSNLYDVYAKSRAQGFGPETRRRVMLGSYVLSHGYYDAYYRKSLLVRDVIIKEFNEIFKEVDLIVTPTSPIPAFKIGEKSQDPLALYLLDIYTVTANIVGNPAISVPNNKNSEGLPLDIQFSAPFGTDAALFAFAEAYEKIRG
jgi:aspartyl-tRNA(Asn)/glutamyl-tRNA(Gln) amidotransferase subunit A